MIDNQFGKNDFTTFFMSQVVDYTTPLIDQRDKEIGEIVDGMKEINEIYSDLSLLITDQGQALDNIEANMGSADNAVRSGTQNLSKASKYQKKSRKFLVGILVVLVVVIAIVLIAIFA